MHFPAEACAFLHKNVVLRVVGNRRKLQEGFKAQESRTLANFHKIPVSVTHEQSHNDRDKLTKRQCHEGGEQRMPVVSERQEASCKKCNSQVPDTTLRRILSLPYKTTKITILLKTRAAERGRDGGRERGRASKSKQREREQDSAKAG